MPGTVSWVPEFNRAVLNPDANLEANTQYRAVADENAKDLAGNPLDQAPATAGQQDKI